jgi:hypothetical protein
MADNRNGASRFNWRLPAWAALAALLIYVLITIHGYGIGEILYILFITFVAAPVFCFLVLITAVFDRRWPRMSVLSMPVLYCAVSWALLRSSAQLHSTARWWLHSKDYKAEVLKQPASGNGELGHVEWDGWGGFGAGDTVVYLVFDPNDSLAGPARNHSRGKFSGIPCEVPEVRRLESQWYTVLFYTDTGWDRCS